MSENQSISVPHLSIHASFEHEKVSYSLNAYDVSTMRAAIANLRGTSEPTPTGVSAEEKAAVLAPKPAKDTKPAPAAATKPTAEVAKADAPVEKAKPSAPAVDYAQLSTSVLKLMKLDAAAAPAIAKGLGFDTFKLMKEAENATAVFAQAKTLVDAKIAELEAV